MLLALGANAEADAALRPVFALIDAYDLPHLRPHADWLATRLWGRKEMPPRRNNRRETNQKHRKGLTR
jgi:hypothetical protein